MLPSLCAHVMADATWCEVSKASGPSAAREGGREGGREREGGETCTGCGSNTLSML